jgi:hypothetical protein
MILFKIIFIKLYSKVSDKLFFIIYCPVKRIVNIKCLYVEHRGFPTRYVKKSNLINNSFLKKNQLYSDK